MKKQETRSRTLSTRVKPSFGKEIDKECEKLKWTPSAFLEEALYYYIASL